MKDPSGHPLERAMAHGLVSSTQGCGSGWSPTLFREVQRRRVEALEEHLEDSTLVVGLPGLPSLHAATLYEEILTVARRLCVGTAFASPDEREGSFPIPVRGDRYWIRASDDEFMAPIALVLVVVESTDGIDVVGLEAALRDRLTSMRRLIVLSCDELRSRFRTANDNHAGPTIATARMSGGSRSGLLATPGLSGDLLQLVFGIEAGRSVAIVHVGYHPIAAYTFAAHVETALLRRGCSTRFLTTTTDERGNVRLGHRMNGPVDVLIVVDDLGVDLSDTTFGRRADHVTTSVKLVGRDIR